MTVGKTAQTFDILVNHQNGEPFRFETDVTPPYIALYQGCQAFGGFAQNERGKIGHLRRADQDQTDLSGEWVDLKCER